MNENAFAEEFGKIYFEIETILPDKVLQLVHKYYYPHGVLEQPLTPAALNAIREIHRKYVFAVASVLGCSAEELAKTLDEIHREDDRGY